MSDFKTLLPIPVTHIELKRLTKYDLIIRNGWVAAKDGTEFVSDIACVNGRIDRISSTIDANAVEEINAEGHLVLPGAVDVQVHFRDPGNTHKEDLGSGSRAAVKGGVTSFLEMPNTKPPTINQQALDRKLARAAQVCVANFGFFVGATPNNLDAVNTVNPVCGIKIFMGSSTGDLLVHKHSDLESIFKNGSRLIAVHAENEERMNKRAEALLDGRNEIADLRIHTQIRDDVCALLATQQATELSHMHDRRLHILHLTSAKEVEYLRENKTDQITVECTPNHLFLTEEDYQRQGSRVQMNPPIRTQHDQDTLWAGLKDGTIDFIATDHAPHTLEEKSQPYPKSPSGMPGVETSLPLMLTAWKSGRCTLAEVLKWMCWAPVETYSIVNKGDLNEGCDADLAIVDVENYRPVRDADMFTKVGWSPFAGRELTGWPVWTVVNGKIAFADGKIREDVRGTALAFHQ